VVEREGLFKKGRRGRRKEVERRRGRGFSQMRSDRNRNGNTKTTGYRTGIETSLGRFVVET
jgi:hypothetical protein